MDKDRIKLLEWFRNFVYTDIDSLNSFGITRLGLNLNILKEYGFLDEEINQKSLMAHVIVAFEHPDFISNESLKTEKADFSKRFHDILNNVTDNTKQEGLVQPFHLDVVIGATIDEGLIRIRFERPQNALGKDNRLLLVFLRNISGLQTKCIKQCGECGEWFFHFSKREKFYCSNKCAARKGNRERRVRLKEENPEASGKELSENAQRARKSYERKAKAKSGKNVIVKKKRTKQRSLFK